MNPEARKYLAEIGRRGGQKSKRKLTKAQARKMVRARTAKRAALLHNIAVIEEIRAELGERFDYRQWVNGNGILFDSVSDRKTGFSAQGSAVHYGADPRKHALELRDQLLSGPVMKWKTR